jgi:hypothetical protein
MTTIGDKIQPAPETATARCDERPLAPLVDWSALGAAEHLAQFYESDGFLLDALEAYVTSGLDAGDACLVIATQDHRERLEERLRALGVDLMAARREGTYLDLDAEALLRKLLREQWPDAQRFGQVVGRLLSRAGKRGRHVRIFGEMVSLLWAEGNHAAAIRLEELWNQLQGTASVPFTLFCGYTMPACAGSAYEESFTTVCQQHSRVIPVKSMPPWPIQRNVCGR